MTDHTALTRRLNDMTRSQPEIANASWVMTQGVAALLISDDGDDPPKPDAARFAMLARHAGRVQPLAERQRPLRRA